MTLSRDSRAEHIDVPCGNPYRFCRTDLLALVAAAGAVSFELKGALHYPSPLYVCETNVNKLYPSLC